MIQNKKVIFHIFKKINLKFFYVDSLIMDHLTIWREKNFDLLQLIVFDIMRISLAFYIFQPTVKHYHHQTFVYTYFLTSSYKSFTLQHKTGG